MFNLSAEITVDKKFDSYIVKKAVNMALREKFSLDRMQVGQRVYKSEVIALIQQIEGVVNTELNHLYDSEKSVGLFDLSPNVNEIFRINPNEIILKVKII